MSFPKGTLFCFPSHCRCRVQQVNGPDWLPRCTRSANGTLERCTLEPPLGGKRFYGVVSGNLSLPAFFQPETNSTCNLNREACACVMPTGQTGGYYGKQHVTGMMWDVGNVNTKETMCLHQLPAAALTVASLDAEVLCNDPAGCSAN